MWLLTETGKSEGKQVWGMHWRDRASELPAPHTWGHVPGDTGLVLRREVAAGDAVSRMINTHTPAEVTPVGGITPRANVK